MFKLIHTFKTNQYHDHRTELNSGDYKLTVDGNFIGTVTSANLLEEGKYVHPLNSWFWQRFELELDDAVELPAAKQHDVRLVQRPITHELTIRLVTPIIPSRVIVSLNEHYCPVYLNEDMYRGEILSAVCIGNVKDSELHEYDVLISINDGAKRWLDGNKNNTCTYFVLDRVCDSIHINRV